MGVTSGFREYRTENDSFSRIRAYGFIGSGIANGPAYFRVWTKSGLIQDYGATAETATSGSTIISTASGVGVTWALSRSADVKGNTIDYRYEQRQVAWGTGGTVGSPSNGLEWNLTEVLYTGTATGAPTNRVNLVYEDRPATVVAGKAHQRSEIYHLGAKTLSVRRLTKIQTTINLQGTPLKTKTWVIAYDTSSTSSRSRISTVAECPGPTESPCLPAHQFQYSAGGTELFTEAALGLSPLGSLKTTLLHLPSATPIGSTTRPGASRSVLTADFNGDGRTDILLWDDNPANNRLYVSLGNGFFSTATAFNITQNLFKSDGCYASYLGDFSGDGLVDILRFKAVNGETNAGFVACTDTTDLYLNQGNGSFQRITVQGLPVMQPAVSIATCNKPMPGDPCGDQVGWSRGETFYVLDINGDGLLDIVIATVPAQPPVLVPTTTPCASVVCTRVFLGNGSGSFTEVPTNVANQVLYSRPQGAPALGQPSHIADVDGNGLMDIASAGAFGPDTLHSNWRSRGDGNFDRQQVAGATAGNDTCAYPIDFNGDGRPDCLTPGTGTAPTAQLGVSDGANNSIPVAAFDLNAAGVLFNNDLPNSRPISGVTIDDFDNDGRADILRWHNDPTQNRLYLSNGDGTFRQSSTFNLNTAGFALRTGDNNVAHFVGDFLGNGRKQVLRVHSAATLGGANVNRLVFRGDLPPDLLTAVITPSGLRTDITWAALGGSRYTSDRSLPGSPNANAASYPQYDTVLGNWLVTTLVADSGVGTNRLTTEVAYTGQKATHDGRGSLGFRLIRRQSPGPSGTPVTVSTTRLQGHPYTGNARLVETRNGTLAQTTATLLERTQNIFCEKTATPTEVSTALGNGLPCITSAKRQRPYLLRSTRSNWDINGVALPTATTDATVNDTGDPLTTQVTRQATVAGSIAQTSTRLTTFTYWPDKTACSTDTQCNWQLGRAQTKVEQSTVPDSFAALTTTAGTAPYATATAGTRTTQGAGLPDVSFGSVVVGSSASQTATLTSNGTTALSLLVPSSRSVSGSGFAFVSTTCGTSLAVGASCTVTLSFTPLAQGSQMGLLTLSTGAGNTVAVLNGTGGSPGGSSTAVVLSNAAFGTNTYGAAIANQAITVRNGGTAPLTLTVSGHSSPYTLVSNTCTNVAVNAQCTITFSMANTVIGTANQNVTLTGAGSGPVSATITGTVNGSRAVVESGDWAFGTWAPGASPPARTVTVRNTGNVAMTLSGISGSSAPFSLTGNTCSAVAANATCTLTLAMSTANGGSWTQNTSTVGASVNAAITASGTVSSTVATIIAGDLAFGSVALDASPAPRSLTIRNDGTGAMTLSGLSGLSAPFSLVGNTCSGITAGNSCTLTVSMSASATGSWSQAVSTMGATTNASTTASGAVGGSILVFVGAGTVALDFGTVGQGSPEIELNWPFQNQGNQAMTLSVSAGNAPFTILNGCNLTIGPGAGCSIRARMATTAVGTFSQSGISVTGATRGNRSDLSLAGVVIPTGTTVTSSASVLNWATVPPGGSQSRTLTLTNTGSVAATSLQYTISYTIASNLGDHFIGGGGTCPAAGGTLGAGQSCTLEVVFAANCTAGSRNGKLAIGGNFPALNVDLNATILAGSCQ